mmetsp:Transcript_40013/g.29515  ORF Transcript_40013/g.29515 Transcript_40013/m.29515 type:complete len:89 (-) Transcript_40013:720-986(-)|eukprot:CAMPEP_0202973032 /NCGR_PEP_ID=MMETSP1396-20130829/45421_1 /ASSEMBLY_ACC=CAM_ASM_000872 /TAXON_ID= /ORGANISM="Pseudokeronopsis sp., Strain Brazil" /LENGTH=88 /DNA_ID=CAMNT_0049704383 /DNA_START=106 /DNA_END=372 /DNA_ORIENTATION=+
MIAGTTFVGVDAFEELRQKEQYLLEQAEKIHVGGLGLVALMNICKQLESKIIQELNELIQSCFNSQDGWSGGMDDQWVQFNEEVVPSI